MKTLKNIFMLPLIPFYILLITFFFCVVVKQEGGIFAFKENCEYGGGSEYVIERFEQFRPAFENYIMPTLHCINGLIWILIIINIL